MGSTRRRFTSEFKPSAVGFVLDQNRSIKGVAEHIGTSEASLGKWVKIEREWRACSVPADAELNESERVELVSGYANRPRRTGPRSPNRR